MPFAYYGAKHGLADKYPSPVGGTIVEPFAGSAAYSVRWAAHVDRVILYDADPAVIALWERVKAMTVTDLDAITEHLVAGWSSSVNSHPRHGCRSARSPVNNTHPARRPDRFGLRSSGATTPNSSPCSATNPTRNPPKHPQNAHTRPHNDCPLQPPTPIQNRPTARAIT